MPTVLRVGQYRFFFYSDEGSEPAHVHIESAEKRAKFWLLPIELTWNDGYRTAEIKEIATLIADYADLLIGEWNAHFQL